MAGVGEPLTIERVATYAAQVVGYTLLVLYCGALAYGAWRFVRALYRDLIVDGRQPRRRRGFDVLPKR